MSLLVRKINKAKWLQINIEQDSDVSADAITNCLRTSNNCLSVWCIKSLEKVEEAALALAANQDHLETIDIVVLEEESLTSNKIDIVKTDGETPVNDLIGRHRDISELTYAKLGVVKNLIVDSIRKDKVKRYTKSDLKKILLSSIREGKLESARLKESVRKKIDNS